MVHSLIDLDLPSLKKTCIPSLHSMRNFTLSNDSMKIYVFFSLLHASF